MKSWGNRAWRGWLRVARFIGDWIARFILTLFYFTLFVPFALIVKKFSDPLAIKPVHKPGWIQRTTGDLTVEDMRRQF
jgi:hypothetical protein